MRPKLYQYAACPFCSKVSSLLHLKNADYETIEVHPLKKKEIAFSAGYRAVPIYVDGSGVQVNDSTPIMRHIEREFPEPKVFRGDAEEEKWLTWSENYVKGLPTAIYGTLGQSLRSFSYVTKVGKFNAWERFSIKWSGALVMTMVAGKIKKRQGIEHPAAFVREKASEWAEGLAGRAFMGGLTPGGADVAVYGITRVVWNLDAGNLLRENSAFAAWFDRMRTRVEGSAS